MASFNAPQSYKAMAITKKDGPLEAIDVPWKDPEAGQVIVKVLACGVCHTDSWVFEQVVPTGFPRVPGHEFVGDVVMIPPSEKMWKVGDRVGGGWHAGHCFECFQCRKGDFMTCQQQNAHGLTTDGGYSEYVTIRSEAVIRIPSGMDPAEVGPLLCAGVAGFNPVRHMDISPGDIVAVQGVGGLGHLAIQFYSRMGYRTIALSSSSSKEAMAKELGAQDYFDSSKEPHATALQKVGGAKIIACTAPTHEGIRELLDGLSVDGQLLLLAPVPDVSLPTLPMILKRLSVKGWAAGAPHDCEDTVNFAKVKGVKCRVERYPLAKANEAYTSMIEGKARFRAVIVP